MKRRLLIVNADDFGQNTAINRGILRAHEEAIMTSANFMFRGAAAGEAAAYARSSPRLSVGLHADLARGCAATASGAHSTNESTSTT